MKDRDSWPWPHIIKPHSLVEWGYVDSPFPESYAHFLDWNKKNKTPALRYLTDHREHLRSDLRLVYPDFQSALVCLFDYRGAKNWLKQQSEPLSSMAGFAWGFEGEDYHIILKRDLEAILEGLKKEFPGLDGKVAIDTLPILERDLAYRAGLGWFGKNSMLIHRRHGSFVMIGSLLLNQKIAVIKKEKETDHCGQCRRCVDACPTTAINPETRQIDGSQCLTTFSIETFKDLPAEFQLKKESGPLLFGCDICQDVCPWNKKGLMRFIEPFRVTPLMEKLATFFQQPLSSMKSHLEGMSKKQYQIFFQGTSFLRLTKNGLLKNIAYIAKCFHSFKD
jgi:epoxyqueuosine reductase